MAKKKKSNSYKAYTKHQSRNLRSRKIDESKTSKTVYNRYNKSWSKNPNRSDIRHIDTKKHKARNITEVRNFISGVIPSKKTPKFKSFITVKKPMANKQKQLQRVANTRYSNVKISKRKKKGTPNDYKISIKR